MQIISFPAHYQSVYTNFDISSFSLISCNATCVKMQCIVNGVAQQKDKNGVIEAIKWPRTNGEMEFSFLFGRREKC